MQCIYAAVTLAVYIGGMAGDLPWLSGKQTSGQGAALAGKEQGPATAEQQRPQHAAWQQQPVLESSCKAPAAGLQGPEAAEDGTEDEGWELLAASASPDSSAQPMPPQQDGAVGGVTSLEPGPSTDPGLSGAQAEGARKPESSRAKAALGGISSQAGSHERADRSSRGAHDGDVDMHAETEGRSLLYPRSASTAAELTGGLEDQSPVTSDSHDQAPYQQASDEREHGELHVSGREQDAAGTQAAAAAAFDREEVLWRCTTFTVQVRPLPKSACFRVPP